MKLQFPTALRKMWSGGEVQDWIDEQLSNQWVSVTDRLPKYDSKVDPYDEFIVYCQKDSDSIITTLSWTEHGWYDDMDNPWDQYVTYWMPLPKPPKL